jgi:plastocyanin
VSSNCTNKKIVDVDVIDDPKTIGGFSPSNVTVSAGTTVKFVWKSSGHNLNPFHTGIEASGYVFSKLFDKPGQYAYNCQVHPGQNGVVYVK